MILINIKTISTVNCQCMLVCNAMLMLFLHLFMDLYENLNKYMLIHTFRNAHREEIETNIIISWKMSGKLLSRKKNWMCVQMLDFIFYFWQYQCTSHFSLKFNRRRKKKPYARNAKCATRVRAQTTLWIKCRANSNDLRVLCVCVYVGWLVGCCHCRTDDC